MKLLFFLIIKEADIKSRGSQIKLLFKAIFIHISLVILNLYSRVVFYIILKVLIISRYLRLQ
jgi:hypothetical protein